MFRTVFTLAALMTPTIASAAGASCATEDWVRRTTDIVQIAVEKVVVPPQIFASMDTTDCPVTGTIRRVFQGSLKIDRQIEVGVTCHAMVGRAEIVMPQVLEAAKVIELPLDKDGQVTDGAGVVILDAPTDNRVWPAQCE